MAGAGYKLFNTGDVLTAAQVNTYLNEQTVMVFADSAARTTALSGVLSEGMMSYLQDTDSVEVYDGSAWTAIGGGSSPLTTKGDLYTFSTVDARLGVGANGTVLTADSAETTGLKWAAPAGASLTLSQIATGSMSGTSVTISSLSVYDTIILQMNGVTWGTGNNNIRVRINSLTTGNYYKSGWAVGSGGSRIRQYQPTATSFALQDPGDQVYTNATNNYFYIFTSCKSVGFTQVIAEGFYGAASSVDIVTAFNGIITSAEAVSSLVLATASGYTFNAGTYTVWGG
jgi:hypothetical protein